MKKIKLLALHLLLCTSFAQGSPTQLQQLVEKTNTQNSFGSSTSQVFIGATIVLGTFTLYYFLNSSSSPINSDGGAGLGDAKNKLKMFKEYDGQAQLILSNVELEKLQKKNAELEEKIGELQNSNFSYIENMSVENVITELNEIKRKLQTTEKDKSSWEAIAKGYEINCSIAQESLLNAPANVLQIEKTLKNVEYNEKYWKDQAQSAQNNLKEQNKSYAILSERKTKLEENLLYKENELKFQVKRDIALKKILVDFNATFERSFDEFFKGVDNKCESFGKKINKAYGNFQNVTQVLKKNQSTLVTKNKNLTEQNSILNQNNLACCYQEQNLQQIMTMENQQSLVLNNTSQFSTVQGLLASIVDINLLEQPNDWNFIELKTINDLKNKEFDKTNVILQTLCRNAVNQKSKSKLLHILESISSLEDLKNLLSWNVGLVGRNFLMMSVSHKNIDVDFVELLLRLSLHFGTNIINQVDNN